MKKLFLLFLILTLVLTAVYANAENYSLARPLQPVSDFSAELLSGETFTLSEHRGKVVIVNVWTTWCSVCVSKLPVFQHISQEFPDDVVVLGLNAGEREDRVRAFIEQSGYTYPHAADTDHRLTGSIFLTSALPYTVVIDTTGTVLEQYWGGGVDFYLRLRENIQTALAAKEAVGVTAEQTEPA